MFRRSLTSLRTLKEYVLIELMIKQGKWFFPYDPRLIELILEYYMWLWSIYVLIAE